MGGSEVHERMTEEPSTSQKLNPEDTGKLFMEAGVSGIVRVKYGEHEQDSKDKSSLITHEKIHTGEIIIQNRQNVFTVSVRTKDIAFLNSKAISKITSACYRDGSVTFAVIEGNVSRSA